MNVTVDRLEGAAWRQLRDLRLEALRDSPSAFWATWEEESRYGVDEWTRFARTVEWFFAARNGHAVGLVGVLQHDECPDEREIIGMWVRGSERGRGVAGSLLVTASRWAEARGTAALTLWVTPGNERARVLYERHGFALTGEEAPMPEGRTGSEVRMRRVLSSSRTCSRPDAARATRERPQRSGSAVT